MDPHPGLDPAPHVGAALRIGEVGELLPGEERITHVGHGPLDTGLVLWASHPGRIDHEPAGLGVLDERDVEPWSRRIGPVNDRLHVVGHEHLEDAAVELPRGLAPGDHVLEGLPPRQPHEGVPRDVRSEDQRPQRPPPTRDGIEHHPHPPEIDLQLMPRLTIDHRDRGAPPAEPELVGRIPVQGPIRNLHPATGEEVLDLGQLQILLQPRLDPVVLGTARLPRCPMPGRPLRADRLDHRAEQLVRQLALTAVADQPRRLAGIDVAAHSLAIQPDRLGDRSQPHLVLQPQPQHFLGLDHGDLPVGHALSVDTANTH